MADEEDYSRPSSAAGPAPQQSMPILLNREEFDTLVAADVENLCCVVVTSTLCAHSGTRKIKYPPPPRQRIHGDGDSDEEEMEEEQEEEEEEQEDDMGGPGGKGGRFFAEMKARLVTSDHDLKQRRHVRFFHVCACAEEETNIAPLIAKDAAFTISGRQPNEVEVRELHKTAHHQLLDLLHYLDVRSTPCMLFFVRGQRLRYSMMTSPSPANAAIMNAVAGTPRDVLVATGANYLKWKVVLQNAVGVRNDVLKEYDADIKEKARLAKKAAKRAARLERKRRQAEEEAEEAEEEAEDEED